MSETYQPAAVTNGYAVAALVLGIFGFVVTAIPMFVGLILGVVPNILAVVFGIIAINHARKTGVGLAMSIVAVVLAGVSLLSVSFGAGIVW